MSHLLERVFTLLKTDGLECAWLENTPTPQSHLRVLVGNDFRQKPQYILIEAASENASSPQSDDLSLLQFVAPLSLTPKPKHLGALLQFLLQINAAGPFPGFCYAANTQTVFFRYVWACSENKLDTTALKHVVGLVALQADLFLEKCVQIAEAA